MSLRFLSLYSGIGLHDLGFARAGIDIVGQVELDPFCRAVLEQHWPGLPRWEDVRGVTADVVRGRCGRIDGITGGFACQDVSAAGKGAGLGRATRSGLTWREMFRLVRSLRPAWLVIENVPVLRGRGADRVLDALERIGYACWPVVVGAEHVGAPHRRHRVWIIGRLGDSIREPIRDSQRRGDAGSPRAGAAEASQRQRLWPDARDAVGSAEVVGDGQAVPAGPRLQGQRPDAGQPQVAEPRDDGARLADAEHDGRRQYQQGRNAQERTATRWPSRPGEPQHEWEAPRLVEPGVGLAADGRARRLAGFARRHALKALGNGNPPQCAELIARGVLHLHQLIEASHASPGGPGRSCPVPGEQKEKP